MPIHPLNIEAVFFFLNKDLPLISLSFFLKFFILNSIKQEMSRIFILNELTAIELRTEVFFS